jgi:uncharacterized protein YbjT (DUF2867 family)
MANAVRGRIDADADRPAHRHAAQQGARSRPDWTDSSPPPEDQAHGWPGSVETFDGMVTSPGEAATAFRGATHIFLAGLAGLVPANLRELTNLILKSDVQRIAILSSHGSDFESEYSAETWQWLAFERALERRGVGWTYIRPTGVLANALVGGYPITGSSWARKIRDDEPIREFSPSTPYPFIDEDDLAGVIAAVLLGGDDCETVLDVSGMSASAADRLRSISRALARDVRWQPLPSDDAAREHWRREGWPEVTIEVTLWASKELGRRTDASREILARQEATAARLLGRPTRTFDQWLDDHVQDFR